jgi:deoxyribonuclease V
LHIRFKMCQPFWDIPDLQAELMKLLEQVPAGRVTTYGDLAYALGNRIAARWVGHVMLNHQHRVGCHCHRVVRAGGQLGLYIAGGARAKARQLRREGVQVRRTGIDLPRFGMVEFRSERPLEKLTRVQEDLIAKVSLTGRRSVPRLVAGVDVSYGQSDMGIAAYALVETSTGKLVWSTTLKRPVVFPYITSYLAFREAPILLELIEKVRLAGRLAEPVLVDGSGMLHQRHAGIATHVGVAACLATIGVTKKLLCGEVDVADLKPQESRPIVHQDRPVGVAIRPTAGSVRPIFVSPGNRIDLGQAERVVRTLLLGRRLPEPLYWADRLSRKAARAESDVS